MRISDWSSDVCSSDLVSSKLARRASPAFFRTSKRCRDAAHRRGKADRHQTSRHIDLRRQREIGRASCRERVCQYVEISVVAVSLKKKRKLNLYLKEVTNQY